MPGIKTDGAMGLGKWVSNGRALSLFKDVHTLCGTCWGMARLRKSKRGRVTEVRHIEKGVFAVHFIYWGAYDCFRCEDMS